LAYQNKIRGHKNRYSEKLSSTLKLTKVFGYGRGTYKKDPYTLEEEIRKRATLTTIPDTVRTHNISL
jgi:hypothetical protein